MKLALQHTIPADLVKSIDTDTPAGKDAARLLMLALSGQVELDYFRGWKITFDLPEGLWLDDNSNFNMTSAQKRRMILVDPDNLLLSRLSDQREQRGDEVVRILHGVLSPYGVVAILVKTWGFMVFGQPGEKLWGRDGRKTENVEFSLHLEQMKRLGLKSPLLES